MKFILGKKIGMSQIFDEDGNIVPVTLIEAGPCKITQVKTKEKDGYVAVQIGFGKAKKLSKPNAGHLKDLDQFRYLKEFKSSKDIDVKRGDEITVSNFKEKDKVKISGISKGKGFQGGVKRWGFSGRNATHGVKHEQRTIGSIGSAFPQRVFKGKKMPGRMGTDRTTIKNLKVAHIDPEKNILAIKGAIPGKKGGLLEIQAIE